MFYYQKVAFDPIDRPHLDYTEPSQIRTFRRGAHQRNLQVFLRHNNIHRVRRRCNINISEIVLPTIQDSLNRVDINFVVAQGRASMLGEHLAVKRNNRRSGKVLVPLSATTTTTKMGRNGAVVGQRECRGSVTGVSFFTGACPRDSDLEPEKACI